MLSDWQHTTVLLKCINNFHPLTVRHRLIMEICLLMRCHLIFYSKRILQTKNVALYIKLQKLDKDN